MAAEMPARKRFMALTKGGNMNGKAYQLCRAACTHAARTHGWHRQAGETNGPPAGALPVHPLEARASPSLVLPVHELEYRRVSSRRRWSDGASCRRRPSRKSVDQRLHRARDQPLGRDHSGTRCRRRGVVARLRLLREPHRRGTGRCFSNRTTLSLDATLPYLPICCALLPRHRTARISRQASPARSPSSAVNSSTRRDLPP